MGHRRVEFGPLRGEYSTHLVSTIWLYLDEDRSTPMIAPAPLLLLATGSASPPTQPMERPVSLPAYPTSHPSTPPQPPKTLGASRSTDQPAGAPRQLCMWRW